MDINEARELAHEIMAEYIVGWDFDFDQAKRRFGLCSYRRQTIFLSAPLTKINERDVVEDVIRHEVAHVIAGPEAKHGREWREACYVTGATPKSCVQGPHKSVEAPWRIECPNGHFSVPRHRRKKNLYCGKCKANVVFVPNTDIASN